MPLYDLLFDMETLKVVNLIGPPGSGKSTQADLIVSRQEFGYVATGDIVKECTPGYETETNEAKRYRAGYSSLLLPYLGIGSRAALIPDAVMVPILLNEFHYQAAKGSREIVLAGSIKNAGQAENFHRSLLNVSHSQEIQQVIIRLDATDDTLLKRLKLRAERNSRPDDGVIAEKLANARSGDAELDNYYLALGLLTNITTEQKDIETIYQIILGVINEKYSAPLSIRS